MALEQGTVAVGRVAADGVWRASSADTEAEPADPWEVPSLVPNPSGGGWVRYVQGVAAGYDDVVRAAGAPAHCAYPNSLPQLSRCGTSLSLSPPQLGFREYV